MEEKFKIERPNLKNIDEDKILKRFRKLNFEKFKEYFEKANEPKYLYWDKIKYKKSPPGFKPEEFWLFIRQLRNVFSVNTPIKNEDGKYFRWFRLPYTEKILHKIDMSSGGQMFTKMETLSKVSKQKFISRGILEEAIASSQLEGAHTTRQAAKKMILEKQEPKNESEQMILNNYNMMLALEENYKNQELSIDLLIEMHKTLTQKTIKPSQIGRLRKDKDNIVVAHSIGSKSYTTHIPPREKFLKKEIKRFIEYANDKTEEDSFLHPIIKAIFIHFWIGYLHPFVDGNGRIARTLFYWYLLKNDYWAFMYLPISTIIKKAPVQYAMAYIYSEQDSHDLTYFYDFHIRKIIQSLKNFNEYIKEKIFDNKTIDSLLSRKFTLNNRQKHLIHYLTSEENNYTTATSHSTLNGISRQTAVKDIKFLKEKGLVQGKKEGKFVKYKSTDKLLLLTHKKN